MDEVLHINQFEAGEWLSVLRSNYMQCFDVMHRPKQGWIGCVYVEGSWHHTPCKEMWCRRQW
jgi:hypothetical protein